MKLSTQIVLGFSIVLILSIFDSGFNYLLSLKVEQNTNFLNKSQDIIRNSGRLHKSMIEMQSSVRGYLLTQDSSFLDNYKSGLKNIPPLYLEQKDLVKENKEQVIILDSIYFLHLQWISYAKSLIKAIGDSRLAEGSNETYIQLFENKLKKQVGKKINDEISKKFSDFDRTEYRLRSKHGNNLFLSIQKTHTYSIIFIVLTIIIGVISIIYIVYLISNRIKEMVKLAENISKGEFSTMKDSRKDELTSLSTSLNIMSEKLSKNISDLEKRNVELDKFAYVVSHDLKAPIRGIHNVIKWIEEDLGKDITPEMKKYLDIIPQRTKRMEDLINGLLAYARIREKTKPEKTNVHDMVKEIIDSIVPRSFKVELDNLPVIVTERLKLEQIFTNLISNAVKYTPHDNGHIIITCKDLKDLYEFSVKDNGIGIEEEYHERIFEIFQTLREKDEKESTGIGLSIIKKILDEQHCNIRVVSTISKGAEFIFTWPK
jgi:signal transduction histidine kinase